MKNYYCPVCKQFKNRLQLKKQDDTRVAYLTCRYCHSSNIFTTEDIMKKLISRSLLQEDLNSKHGSYL